MKFLRLALVLLLTGSLGLGTALLVHGTAADQPVPPAQPVLAQPKEAQEQEPRPGQGWSRELTGGGRVELLGVLEHGGRDRTWWRPDGTPLVPAPYDELGARVNHEKRIAREFAVRLDGLPKGSSWRWDFKPSGGTAQSAPRKEGKTLSNVAAVAVSFPPKTRTATIRFGVATGPWQATFASKGRSSQGGAEGSAAFGTPRFVKEPRFMQGRTVLTVSHNLRQPDLRLVAVDLDDEVHPTVFSSMGGGGDFSQLEGEFDLPLERVREFQLQTRPFEWVEFADVALFPTK